MSRLLVPLLFLILTMTTTIPSVSADADDTDKAKAFVEKYTATLRPLDIAANRAWWDANISGKDEDFKRKEEAQNKIDALLSDKQAFAEVKAIKEKGGIDDPDPQAGHRHHLPGVPRKAARPRVAQEDDRPVEHGREEVQHLPRTIRIGRRQGGGVVYDDAKVRKILKTSKLSERRKEVWEASQGGRQARRAGPGRAGQAPQPGRQEARLRQLPRHAALPQRAERRRPDQAVRRARRADARAVPKAKAEIDAELAKNCGIKVERADALALSRPVLPGSARRLQGRPRQDLRGARTSSSCAATSTAASACRSTW